MRDKNSINAYNSLDKMSQMLRNFETLRCGDGFKPCSDADRAIALAACTDFSVQEILRPSFGSIKRTHHLYDSDGAYTSDNCDIYSSCDEIHTDTDSIRSSSPEYNQTLSDEPLDLSKTSNYRENHQIPSDLNVVSLSERFRRRVEEDGYSSSDSEAALDLRIRRKKTPPAMRNQIPAWVFCTRYSDRPSAGPRSRKRRERQVQRKARTAFTDQQLRVLNIEFEQDQYLSESRRQRLADELGIHEESVKVWFQNRRAKAKKRTMAHPLALELHALGLYDHKVAPTE
ncbi:HME2B-like protein [Mya arenaria]|uniref:HME2B-like protein n=1 Tax=Mya arenaria TaxID=6604 RepID=A0ABY7E6T2_MYAAR|nr:homeobox protein engrailed-2-B-like [Mya arenaria]WAR04493.1 HME2B-like protein [Mya arenaria]